MKHLIIPLSLAAGFIAMSTMEASAVVCARGVVRAGCVAAGGAAVVVGRPVVRRACGATEGRCSSQGVLTIPQRISSRLPRNKWAAEHLAAAWSNRHDGLRKWTAREFGWKNRPSLQ
jgi:hypothetical protein